MSIYASVLARAMSVPQKTLIDVVAGFLVSIQPQTMGAFATIWAHRVGTIHFTFVSIQQTFIDIWKLAVVTGYT